ncbi:MAG: MXAN_6640 family putative metalloprotease, partial [Candidatus Zixiibacteriota bacterium]
DSPAGQFKVHYTTTGPHAVYNVSRDSDHDGVPDYVEQVAMILDSVYEHIIDTLGYPEPPKDDFYPSGGDDRYDVYLRDTSGGVFGVTYPDSEWVGGTGAYRSTSFLQIDNDYQEAEFRAYNNRPLDAVRVTCAHEFFHAVQFGIDSREFEESQGVQRSYWMEMSATWMEEEIYDNINDYYTYLPYFFTVPRQSLQSFGNYHEYGSVVFAIFLSEKFGRDIIKDIWELCGSLGNGAHFLIAADSAIKIASGGEYDWPSAFREFALWNYFTGERACFRPPDIGYSEGKDYPAIPDMLIREFGDTLADTIPMIINHTEYPILVPYTQNLYLPEHNAATYVRFDHLRAIMYETFWKCTTSTNPMDTCLGQLGFRLIQVFDTTSGYDTLIWEESLSVYIAVHIDYYAPQLPQPWGLSVVYQLDSIPDSFVVDMINLGPPPWYNNIDRTYGYLLKIVNPNHYRAITLVVSPATSIWQVYQNANYDPFGLTYVVPELLDSARIDTPIIIDSELVDLPAAILAPYPNPAVVAKMGERPLTFKFQIPTDSFSNIIYTTPFFSVDIFNLAGEFVSNVSANVVPYCREKITEFETSWDMKNEVGEAVASGVYIAVARLYSKESKKELLAEKRAKVAIIR